MPDPAATPPTETPQVPAAAQPAPVAPSPAPPVAAPTPGKTIGEVLAEAMNRNKITTPTAPVPNQVPPVGETPKPDSTPEPTPNQTSLEATPAPAVGTTTKTPVIQYLESRGIQNIQSEEEGLNRLREYERLTSMNPPGSEQTPPVASPAARSPSDNSVPPGNPPQPQPATKALPFHMDQLELSPEDEAIVLECRDEGEDGKPRWAPETPIDVRRRYETVVRNRQTFSKALLSKPAEVLDAYMAYKMGDIEKVVQQKVDQILTQTQQQHVEQQTLHQTMEKNPWMVQVDPRTNQPMIDPRDGLPMFSQAGERVFAHIERLTQRGLGLVEASQIGVMLAQNELGITSSTPAAPPAPPPLTLQQLEEQRRQQQQAVLKGATAPIPTGQGGYQNGTAPTSNGQIHRLPDGSLANAPPRPQNAQAGLGLSMFDRMGFVPTRN